MDVADEGLIPMAKGASYLLKNTTKARVKIGVVGSRAQLNSIGQVPQDLVPMAQYRPTLISINF